MGDDQGGSTKNKKGQWPHVYPQNSTFGLPHPNEISAQDNEPWVIVLLHQHPPEGVSHGMRFVVDSEGNCR